MGTDPIDEVIRMWTPAVVWACAQTRGEQRRPQSCEVGATRGSYDAWGRPRMTWTQQIRENMGEVGVTVDMTLGRKEWRRTTRPTPCRQGYRAFNVSKVRM